MFWYLCTVSDFYLIFIVTRTNAPRHQHSHLHPPTPLSPSGSPRKPGEGSPVPKSRKSQLRSCPFQHVWLCCVQIGVSVCSFYMSVFVSGQHDATFYSSLFSAEVSSLVKWKPGLYSLINTLCVIVGNNVRAATIHTPFVNFLHFFFARSFTTFISFFFTLLFSLSPFTHYMAKSMWAPLSAHQILYFCVWS